MRLGCKAASGSDVAAKRNYAEDQTQASIVAYLRAVLVKARVYAIPNGGLRSKKEAAKMKWTGVLAGVPDLCIIAPMGRAYFIEVKSAKGVLSEAQREFNNWFATNGVPYVVARSLKDVEVAIDSWNLETRTAK